MNLPRLPLNPYAFRQEILVECPRCGGCATVSGVQYRAWSPRVVCAACGYSAHKPEKAERGQKSFVEGLDPAFGLRLWLRETVGSQVLWAYNWKHLEDLEFFLAGEWRIHRGRWATAEPRHSFRTRLPKWMHQSKNRASLLRALARIRKRAFGVRRYNGPDGRQSRG